MTENDATARPVSTAAPSSHSGRWFLAGMGLFLALIGSLFVFLLGRSFLRAWDMRSWPETSCVILTSDVAEKRHDEFSPIEFRQEITYGYEWQGKAYTGDHLTLRDNPWSSKRDLVEQRAAAFPEGKVTTCRVDPAKPQRAVLKPDSLAPGYSIWFPGLFVVGGLVLTLRALRQP
ncbi:MAG: DUF3592 domain-containing protein [Verrucomicrobiota bacterium]